MLTGRKTDIQGTCRIRENGNFDSWLSSCDSSVMQFMVKWRLRNIPAKNSAVN